MACLRISFEEWLNSEPEEPESDRPSEEEMEAFAEAEKLYKKKVSSVFRKNPPAIPTQPAGNI
jgi:hypothetical protein